ncbi:MAG: hypothetical protein AMXMBFR33_13980 [Candidatus Xenobia bacterium]
MRRILILLVLLLAPVLARSIDQDVARLSKELEQIRGLKFTKPVPSQALPQAEVARYLQGLFDQEAARLPFAVRQVFMHQVGLLAPGVDYRKSLRDLYSQQVQGLYDPYKKRFLVATGGSPEADPMAGILASQGFNMQDMLTIHELDHALQDQHFNLLKIDKDTAANFDQAFAAQCLIEGDATLVMIDYVAVSMGLDPSMMDGMMDNDSMLTGAQPGMGNAPPFIQKLVGDPYFRGMSFCKALRRTGGWKKVDQAYRRLPASSEQVLHPERYLRNDRPASLSFNLPDPPAGWKYLGCDVAGEYCVRNAGENLVGAELAARAAEGWGGDLYCSYLKGSQEGLVWLTVWDSEQDAKEFETLAGKLVSRGGVKGLANRVERNKRKVLVLRNAPPGVVPRF